MEWDEHFYKETEIIIVSTTLLLYNNCNKSDYNLFWIILLYCFKWKKCKSIAIFYLLCWKQEIQRKMLIILMQNVSGFNIFSTQY